MVDVVYSVIQMQMGVVFSFESPDTNEKIIIFVAERGVFRGTPAGGGGSRDIYHLIKEWRVRNSNKNTISLSSTSGGEQKKKTHRQLNKHPRELRWVIKKIKRNT